MTSIVYFKLLIQHFHQFFFHWELILSTLYPPFFSLVVSPQSTWLRLLKKSLWPTERDANAIKRKTVKTKTVEENISKWIKQVQFSRCGSIFFFQNFSEFLSGRCFKVVWRNLIFSNNFSSLFYSGFLRMKCTFPDVDIIFRVSWKKQ